MCRATGVSKSSRRPTASCRSRRRATISHGRRNPRRCRRSPTCPFYPPPVIVAPQIDDPAPQHYPAPIQQTKSSFHTKAHANKKTDPQERVMRQMISGMVAAVAVMMTAGAAPAMACGGLFTPCAPCGAGLCRAGAGLRAPVVATRLLHRLRLGHRAAARSGAAVLLRQPGPDLYRSGQLGAASGLSGRLGVLRSVPITTAIARVGTTATAMASVRPSVTAMAPVWLLRYGYGARMRLRPRIVTARALSAPTMAQRAWCVAATDPRSS